MNRLMNYFDIRCKNCGSDYITIDISEDWYNFDDDECCKKNFNLVCRNCYNSCLIGGE